jgi:hypothetical protein
MTQMEVRSTFNEKVKRGMFEPAARWITGPGAKDRLQDGIAQTFEMYSRYALEGDKILDDAVLAHSCRRRAVDHARRFVRDDAQPARDVRHPRNFTQGKVGRRSKFGINKGSGQWWPASPATGPRRSSSATTSSRSKISRLRSQ